MSDAGNVRRETTYSDADDVRGPLWEEAVAAGAGRGALVPFENDEPADDLEDDAPLASDDVSGNLRRYARWQWRDFWRTRGGWLSLGAVLGLWLLVYLASHGERSYDSVHGSTYGPMRPEAVTSLAHAMAAMGGAIAALLGVGGLVSRERERGLQRFLFAKPVRPVRYYLQLLAINSASSLAVLLGTVALATLLLGAMVPLGTVFAVGVGTYVLTAGVTFLISTLTRFDAPIAAAWLIAGFPALVAAENGIPALRPLTWLFPQGLGYALVTMLDPTHVRSSPEFILFAGALVVLLCIAYGLAAFAGGVAVLRRRSIST